MNNKRSYPFDVVEQASDVLAGFVFVDPALNVGRVTQAEYAANVATVGKLQSTIEELERQLLQTREQRNLSAALLWKQTVSGRQTMKGLYGARSSEYAMVRGRRRARPRKAPAATPSSAAATPSSAAATPSSASTPQP